MRLANHPEFERLLRSFELTRAAVAWRGVCFRVAEAKWASSEALLSGQGARRIGGRWNHPGTAAAYAPLDAEAATKEWFAQLRRAGIPPAQRTPAVLTSADVELQSVLDLTDGALLRRLKVTKRGLLEVDWEAENRAGRESLSQALGRAARSRGYEALLVPSAAVSARNLVLFPRALLKGSRVKAHGLKRLP